jgi:hypothetical protein
MKFATAMMVAVAAADQCNEPLHFGECPVYTQFLLEHYQAHPYVGPTAAEIKKEKDDDSYDGNKYNLLACYNQWEGLMIPPSKSSMNCD